MSGSDWYTRNAHWLAGSFFLLVLCVVGYFTLLNTGYNEGYKDAQTASGSAEANYELYERCFRISIREEVINCLETQIKPSRADERAEEDLQAQRNMAFWAAFVGVLTTGIGVLSILVGVVGLRLVRDTLQANVGMHAEAIKQSKISQQQLIASQRPWLKVSCSISGPLQFNVDDRMRSA